MLSRKILSPSCTRSPLFAFWHDVDLSKHAKMLETAVPDWPELNDSIFWSAIAAERAHREATGGGRVTDPFSALFGGCCRYEGGDFESVFSSRCWKA
jgi:hypothetical protein